MSFPLVFLIPLAAPLGLILTALLFEWSDYRERKRLEARRHEVWTEMRRNMRCLTMDHFVPQPGVKRLVSLKLIGVDHPTNERRFERTLVQGAELPEGMWEGFAPLSYGAADHMCLRFVIDVHLGQLEGLSWYMVWEPDDV